MNMLDTIVPRSDQINSDNLIGRDLTIKITGVEILAGDQPVAIRFEGDNDKPYKPGKSMRRVLVQVWGPDASKYVGRSMTLYRDAKVIFGGVAVGGIRISNMSHITSDTTLILTASKASRKPFTVKPLVAAAVPESTPETPVDRALELSSGLIDKISSIDTMAELTALTSSDRYIKLRASLKAKRPELDEVVQTEITTALARCAASEPEEF